MPLYVSRKQCIADEFKANVEIFGAGGGAADVAIPAGYYYNDSSTAAESLASVLQTALNAHPNIGARTFTVTWSTTTGKFTITIDADTFDMDFTGQIDFRDWLGFTTTVGAGAASYVSDACAQGCIFTSSGRANYPRRQRGYTAGQGISQSGKVAHIGCSTTTIKSSWVHEFERLDNQASPLESGTWDDGSTAVPWVWADFFDHHMHTGEPFRYYAAAGGAIGTQEDTYSLRNAPEFKPDRKVPHADTYWTVSLDVASFA